MTLSRRASRTMIVPFLYNSKSRINDTKKGHETKMFRGPTGADDSVAE
jgi:hypothetical protein